MHNKEDPNAVVVKIKDSIHMFLMNDKGQLLNLPSIPISDEENIYKNLKESQIQFINVEFKKLNPSDELKFETLEDFKKLSYSIRDLFSYTIYEKDSDKESNVYNSMKKNEFAHIVEHIYGESHEN